MIKGGGSIHAQNVADAYILGNQNPNAKNPKQMKQGNTFNTPKYITGNSSV